MWHPIKHLQTVNRHRLEVLRCCIKAGIPLQGLLHDLSKYSPSEFWQGVKYFVGTHSPNVEERRLFGYSKAWMHHKGRNKHHYEYWTDYNMKTHCIEPVKMPLRYLKEMFCDRLAASRVYQGAAYDPGHPLKYFRSGRAKFYMHPDTAAMLEKWLIILAEQGEEAALRTVRQTKQKDYGC